jgi:hypothetical protein
LKYFIEEDKVEIREGKSGSDNRRMSTEMCVMEEFVRRIEWNI